MAQEAQPITMFDGNATLYHADCRDVLRILPDNSIDSVCTDPPYALVSIQKRFGKPGSKPAKDVYARGAAGFMGKQWDTGEVAFSEEFWAEVLRVLKPGGHVVAFSGTRTYHRMACAIEDAGFEIRDQLGWVYGSGFPKSHDVSKGIDKKANEIPLFDAIRAHIVHWRDHNGMTNKDLNVAVGSATNGCGMARHWTSSEGSQHAIPSKEQWRKLKDALGWPDCELDAVYEAVKDGAERPVVGKHSQAAAASVWMENYGQGVAGEPGDITAPATDAARQWQGWGTALKPAWEPICLARKPLIGTVAENVLAHGTGALNIDGCRVEATDSQLAEKYASVQRAGARSNSIYGSDSRDRAGAEPHPAGRWPANIVHDGSDEVLAAFPTSKSPWIGNPNKGAKGGKMFGGSDQNIDTKPEYRDEGSAARFFYCAKASRKDRDEGLSSGDGPRANTHPTVKPVSLCQWLCRLVTPPGGTILDPFMGSGSTGKGAILEGFKFIGIEREDEYMPIAEARIKWAINEANKPTKATTTKTRVPANDNVGIDLFSFGGGHATTGEAA